MFSKKSSIMPFVRSKIYVYIDQVVKYVHTSQYIGEFEKLIFSSQIVIGEFWVIFSNAVQFVFDDKFYQHVGGIFLPSQ